MLPHATIPHLIQTLLTMVVPFAFFVGWLVYEQTYPYEAREAISESGFIENIQVVIAFLAILVGLRHVRIDAKRYPWLFGWFVMALFTCLYVFGEEISWGQWVFLWDTPETWAQLNDQGETNLHNTSSWLDQKPRTILETGLVFGTLIMPWLVKIYPHRFNDFWRTVMPAKQCWMIGVTFLATKALDVMGDTWNIRVYYRASELLECYLYYFFFVYLLSFNSTPWARKKTA